MPFSRYLKAIYAGKQNNTTVLKKVIQRSISKSKPKPFEFIDYSNLTNILLMCSFKEKFSII